MSVAVTLLGLFRSGRSTLVHSGSLWSTQQEHDMDNADALRSMQLGQNFLPGTFWRSLRWYGVRIFLISQCGMMLQFVFLLLMQLVHFWRGLLHGWNSLSSAWHYMNNSCHT